MNLNSNLYVCRSPLQLLNCVEARAAYGLGKTRNVLLAFHRSAKDKILMEKILKAYDAWNILHFGPLYPMRKQLPVLLAHVGRGTEYDHCFVGDYTHLINYFLNRLNCKKFVMVDDGNATLKRAELISTDQIHRTNKYYLPLSQAAFAWNEFLQLSPRYLRNAELFTIYNVREYLSEDRTRSNTYNFLSSLASVKTRSDEVWFVGSHWTVLIKTPDYFEQLLKQAVAQRPKSRLVYIPHRKEDLAQLRSFAKTFGFELRPLDSTIELELLLGDHLPTEIISFGSSAIDTLWRLFKIETTVFRIPQIEIADAWDTVITEMYEDYVAKGIKVATLEDIAASVR